MSVITNHIITDVPKFLCCGCGEILSFIGDPLQQCPGCETSFRVSISTIIGVAAPALQIPGDRGRNITICSNDKDKEKLHWMSQLLSSILTLLQNQTELQLESQPRRAQRLQTAVNPEKPMHRTARRTPPGYGASQ
jgi:hypothetical protein